MKQKTGIDWDKAILETLKDLGGIASTEQIYEKIKDHVELTPELTKRVFRAIRYQSIVRTHLTKLKKSGILINPKLGYYKLVKK